MGRIRTIKPEFPQSESMGRVSRDARLTFILLWTLADDSGRLRGNSRMLASLLFPYDDDAPKKISAWLDELERERCLKQYAFDGNAYIEICNWLHHQKIDKPSASKLPAFESVRECSANVRECSSEDQGPRTKEGIKDFRNVTLRDEFFAKHPILTEAAKEPVTPRPAKALKASVFAPIKLEHLADPERITMWHSQQLSAARPVLGPTRADLIVAQATALYATKTHSIDNRVGYFCKAVANPEMWDTIIGYLDEAAAATNGATHV